MEGVNPNTKGMFQRGKNAAVPMIYKGKVKKYGTEEYYTFVTPEKQGNFKNFPAYEAGKQWKFTPNAPSSCEKGSGWSCSITRRAARTRRSNRRKSVRRGTRKTRR
jgi:hypothetical protein